MADTKQDLAAIESKIQAQISKFERQRTINIVLGVVLILIITLYMGFLKNMVTQMSEPTMLATWGAQNLEEQLPEVRKFIANEARTTLPAKLDEMVDMMISKGLPRGRQYLVRETNKFVAEKLEVTEGRIIANIDEAIANHREVIRDLLEGLETERGAKELEDTLVKLISDSLNDEAIAMEIESYGLALAEIDQRLDYFLEADPSHFTEHERITYELLCVLREMANRFKIGEASTKDLGEALGIGE